MLFKIVQEYGLVGGLCCLKYASPFSDIIKSFGDDQDAKSRPVTVYTITLCSHPLHIPQFTDYINLFE